MLIAGHVMRVMNVWMRGSERFYNGTRMDKYCKLIRWGL